MFSFKVFDFSRAQRRSYYTPTAPNAQTTSAATGSTAVSSYTHPELDTKALAALSAPSPIRPGTPSDRTGVISRSGLDVEAQILDGGGMANIGGRGGWRQSDAGLNSPGGERDREELDLSSSGGNGNRAERPGSVRHPTPLRTSST